MRLGSQAPGDEDIRGMSRDERGHTGVRRGTDINPEAVYPEEPTIEFREAREVVAIMQVSRLHHRYSHEVRGAA